MKEDVSLSIPFALWKQFSKSYNKSYIMLYNSYNLLCTVNVKLLLLMDEYSPIIQEAQ